jgi:CRP-like cAMP-binding protein
VDSNKPKKLCEHYTFNPDIIKQIFNDVEEKIVVTIQPGHIICKQDAMPNALYQILEGIVFIKTGGVQPGNKTIDFAGSPELLGLLNVVMQTPYIYDIVSFTQVQLLQIENKVFKHYLDNDPQFAAQVLYLLTKETAHKEGKLFTLLNMSVYKRIGYLLIRLTELFGYDKNKRISTPLRIETLSQLTGSTISTVYNALNKLRLNDSAYYDNGYVYIINYDNLKHQLDGQEQVLMY